VVWRRLGRKHHVPHQQRARVLQQPLHMRVDALDNEREQSAVVCVRARLVQQEFNQSPQQQLRLLQLAARGTKERARLGWPVFGRENFILKTMMFRDVMTVLNERKHLKMVIRSVLDAVSLILS
jgi:hypothetical protein